MLNTVANRYTGTRTSGMPAWLAVLLCGALLSIPGKAFSTIPRGVFCLLPVGGGTGKDPKAFKNPDVDGISIRQNWSDLEPTEGAFNWPYLDLVVAKAAAAGKPVLLRISTQVNKPAWVTTAVTNAGGTFFTFDHSGVSTTIPVFWDPTYLAKKKAMIRALGAHFTNNPAVKIVSASFANANSEDWGVPHLSDEVTRWLAAGYTSQKMLDAGKQIINTTMQAFPNQYVTLSVGSNGHVGGTGNLDPDEHYVARNAVLNARALWPGRLIVQKNTLSTVTPAAPGTGTLYQPVWDSRPDVAGQMIYWSYGDPTCRNNNGRTPCDPAVTLRKSVDIGAKYGMNYIEIYQTDVVNLPTITSYAHALLHQ